MEKKIIILGAGITGLITAWQLAKVGRHVTVIESSPSPGGLSKTTEWDEFRFDYGAHNLFSRNRKIIEFLQDALGDRLRQRDRNFCLYIYKKLIPFPFLGSDIFRAFPPELMLKVLITFTEARFKFFFSRKPDSPHLDEWIIRRFGSPLYEAYFKPYLTRVQCCNPHELSSVIGKKKIPEMRFRKMIRQTIKKLLTKTSLQVQSGVSYYPIRGFGQIPNHYFVELCKLPNVTFRLNERFKRIKVQGKKVVQLQTEKKVFDTHDTDIISTIPLEYLFDKDSHEQKRIAEMASKLQCASMRFMIIKVNKPRISGYWMLSVNDPQMPFYRVSEENTSEFQMAPEGQSLLMFEIPVNPNDELAMQSDEILIRRIIEQFGKIFSINMDDVIEYKSVIKSHCNPRMVVDYQEIIGEVFSFIFSVDNLFSIGRQGLFTYANLDHCVQMGLDFTNAYLRDQGKEGNKELLRQYFNSGF